MRFSKTLMVVFLLFSTAIVSCVTTIGSTPKQNSQVSSGQSSKRVQPGFYSIKLFRPSKVGETLQVKALSMKETFKHIRSGNKTIKRETNQETTLLEGRCTDQQVDQNGEALNTRCVVQEFGNKSGGRYKVLGRANQVIVLKRGNPPVVTLDGQPVADEFIEILDQVVSTDPPDDVNDDMMLGTNHLQKIGSTWPINAKIVAHEWAKSGVIIDPAKLKGRGKLVGVRNRSGSKCFEIRVSIESNSVHLSKMPPGTRVLPGAFRLSLNGLFPTDGRSQPRLLEMQASATFNFTMPTPQGNVSAQISIKQKRMTELTPVP